MRKAAHALAWAHDARPRFAEVGRAIDVGIEVAERVPVECGVCRARRKAARLDPRNPRIARQARHVLDRVGPGLAAVARDLQVAVVGAGPNLARRHGRFADRKDRGVRFGRRVVDGDAARLFL